VVSGQTTGESLRDEVRCDQTALHRLPDSLSCPRIRHRRGLAQDEQTGPAELRPVRPVRIGAPRNSVSCRDVRTISAAGGKCSERISQNVRKPDAMAAEQATPTFSRLAGPGRSIRIRDTMVSLIRDGQVCESAARRREARRNRRGLRHQLGFIGTGKPNASSAVAFAPVASIVTRARMSLVVPLL
jgi:hypothetical protein